MPDDVPVVPPAPPVGDPPALPVVPPAPAAPPAGDPPKDPAKDPVAPVVEPPKVPESYDIKLPSESKLDAAIVDRTAAIARELGLTTNDAAQKLLNSLVTELTTSQTAHAEAVRADVLASLQPGGAVWEEHNTANKAAALVDKEIGGSPEQLDKHVELANNVIRKFGTEATIDFFTKAGLASNAEAVRFLSRIGKAMSEGSLVMPGAEGGEVTQQQKLDRMYPSMAAKP